VGLVESPITTRIEGTAEAHLEPFLAQLVARERLTAQVAERVARVCDQTHDRTAHVLLKLGLLSETLLASELEQFTALQRWVAPDDPPNVLIDNVNTQFLRAREVIPIALNEQVLTIACWDALDELPVRALAFATGRRVERLIGTRTDILGVLDKVYHDDSIADSASADLSGAGEEAEVDRLTDLASDAPVIRLLQELISRAVMARASDIHIEPGEGVVVVRYRLDGMLREVSRYSADMAAPIVSRAKVMAGLNIAERRLPQDGRIRVTVHGKEIDFRVATTPVLHGESVVLRILDRQDVALDFAALGFDEALTRTLREAIARPFGIVLVTGPTGSGKTTTLYAALKEVNTPDKKILTAEDPVEYMLAGVNQVPVKPQIGFTFASALRAFLRQDPDVIMVGEIRDRETADIAIQAALTGHLLLSTLHTNSAAAAVTRLLDMGIDDYLLTSTLHVILGQRLVRRLCESCREPMTPGNDVLHRFGLEDVTNPTWYRSRGCTRCQESGYFGRTSILECFPMTDPIRAMILAGTDARALESEARRDGMRTMFQHGLVRVCAGETTMEEVLRVTSMQ
jgi:general secretion pathway protein E